LKNTGATAVNASLAICSSCVIAASVDISPKMFCASPLLSGRLLTET